ncbi:PE family protein [Mycobacterium asiaticum]|uniref:PE family protein n=1 Tax=Mycobacterium asiaticum TaxID=1790 RepID=UPI000687D199|nr:PE family protein [Mycobacterium asiaticum]ORA09738.1 PE family protein [Mycobacterium asiaticum DSM 44297]
MSQVSVIPDSLVAGAADFDNIVSALDEAHRLAAPATLALSPAAADEVSVSIAQHLSEHAQEYQTVMREAAAFHQQFVANLTASGSAYASAEDLIAALLQSPNAVLDYYTVAGYTLAQTMAGYVMATALFGLVPFLWPLLPIIQLLALARFMTLFSEILTFSPISYPAYIGP